MPPDESPAATPVVPAAAPPAVAPSSGAATQKRENFGQTMTRLGGFSPAPTGTEPDPLAPPAAPVPVVEEPKASKSKKNGKAAKPLPPAPAAAVPPPPDVPPEAAAAVDEMAQLKALAAKLGMEIDSGRVTVAERAQFRELKRKATEALSRKEAEVAQSLEGGFTKFSERFARAEQIEQAVASLDPEQIAKTFGYESYDKMQESLLAKATDPNYAKIRELEKKQADIEAREKQQQEAATAKQETDRLAAARTTYLRELAGVMKASKNPVVAAMHDDPRFVATVMEIQRESYDAVTRSTVTPEQAIKMALRGAERALEQELQSVYERLHRAFGKAPTAEQIVAAAASPAVPAPETDATGARPRPKTAVVPTATVEAAPLKRMNKKEFAVYSQRRMAEAIEQERQAEIASKRNTA